MAVTVEQWNQKQAEYSRRLREIVIPEEVDAAHIKLIISRLDRLRSDAFDDFVRAKTDYHTIERKIETVMRSTVKGSNDFQRRKSQYDAAKEYYLPGAEEPINLFDIRDEYYRRYVFMESLMNQIREKSENLITDANVLATEARLVS